MVFFFNNEKSILLVRTESDLPFLCVLCVTCELISVKFYVFCASGPALTTHLQPAVCVINSRAASATNVNNDNSNSCKVFNCTNSD